jgi:redox-sensitive bicupin YhaK (pirin superfamily)
MDGAFEHHDSTGGGGMIENGSTQWMTAGAGILHDEMPPEWLVTKGGLFHGVQLWVNLPRDLKMTPPRYQDIAADKVLLLSSDDGGALIRLIAGDLDGHAGPGVTWTPITYLHATISPGSRLHLPWNPDFNALVYVLSGSGKVGIEGTAIRDGQLAVFGEGDAITVEADRTQESRSPNLDVLVLGGRPIREPTVFYGPFVMNTREEILKAVEDYQAGRLGTIPASYLKKS